MISHVSLEENGSWLNINVLEYHIFNLLRKFLEKLVESIYIVLIHYLCLRNIITLEDTVSDLCDIALGWIGNFHFFFIWLCTLLKETIQKLRTCTQNYSTYISIILNIQRKLIANWANIKLGSFFLVILNPHTLLW